MNQLKHQIELHLSEFWDERAIEMGEEPHDICELGAAMDSLTSIEVLIEIDKLVGQVVPADKVIQKGGYQTREEFVAQVTTKVLTFLEENTNAK